MRTSREWIDRTAAELDDPAAWFPVTSDHGLEPEERSALSQRLTVELALSPEEMRALQEICREDELSPKQAALHIIRARLLGQPQFGRADRARLRACLELLRALEQHVGRAARPAKSPRLTTIAADARRKEILELGEYLRRVGRAIGESMLGNLQYWRAESGSSPNTAAPHRTRSSATRSGH